MDLAIYLLLTYIIASIPFGLLISKLFGRDIRKEGSGNIGATNVTRVLGKKAGFLVLILDASKGFIPTYYAYYYFQDYLYISLVAIIAVIGHCFSIFMKFKGGKGVATALGVLIALSGKTAFIIILFWLGVFLISGYVSLASILSASLSWVVIFYVENNIYYTIAAFIISLIIFYKHKDNINRLLSDTEHRFLHK
ncbi:glycerol-3-phosphate 1-O-acyltransferase PlsY [Venenivibrio stagnispumantis]|uniref:Glycerol-3-phosphate acyltransferase n=1 Tax=Venenivibrio stagnispumantis TaxID=407998 RepID=A0AA45WLX2_9AQUI|nr:glycerol-3-phosphate 1-O-acyltransferase PlsY [Venenivibrio stagnispumantis]MCW4572888.1 glycerol-3-phosphate 1-O-acyltransferase PlsY [Venenivibrio stagnispumantis]SMP12857.1 glycerol-3-phosphate acyltransferase PlsY [Venenivibrio stagnispumantis]